MDGEVLRCAFREGTINHPIDEQDNKNTGAKPDRDVSLLKPFLQRKVELRNFEEIPLAKLSELLSELVFIVRTEDENDYEHTSRPQRRLRVLSRSSDEDQTVL